MHTQNSSTSAESPNKQVVLVTCAASIVVPSALDAITRCSQDQYEFIGVDAKDDTTAASYLSAFYTVPFANDTGYFSAILDAVLRHKVAYLLVLSDDEAVVLSTPSLREELAQCGCTVLLPSKQVVQTCKDKGDFLQFLTHIPDAKVPFTLVGSAADLTVAADQLGYPQQRFIVKPRNSRGSRGLMVIDSDAKPSDVVTGQNDRAFSLALATHLLAEEDNLDCLAMPFYSGDDYNIDVMCHNGEVVYALIQQRLEPTMGAITLAKTNNDADIHALVSTLVSALEVTGLINIEVARCGQTNEPHVYEINPRPSAAFAFACYQDTDVLADLIAVCTNRQVATKQFAPMTIKRVWQQLYHYD